MFEGLPDDMPEEIKRKIAETVCEAHAHQIIEMDMAQMDGAAYALGYVGGFFSVTDLDTPDFKTAMMGIIKKAAGVGIENWPKGVIRPGGKREMLKFLERKHDYNFLLGRARREGKEPPEMPCFHCGTVPFHGPDECPKTHQPHRESVDGDVPSGEELNLRFGYL